MEITSSIDEAVWNSWQKTSFSCTTKEAEEETDFNEAERDFGLGEREVLTLPEIANQLAIPNEEDFQYWYDDANWESLSNEFIPYDEPVFELEGFLGQINREDEHGHSDCSESSCDICTRTPTTFFSCQET